jgi:hypothetical protein
MISMDEFKNQLYEFIEFRSEPFDAKFILNSCIQPIDKYRVYEALYQLEVEGKIIRLSDGRYASTKMALKRWIRNRLVEAQIPDHLIREIEWAMKVKPEICRSIEEFITEAIKEYIEKIRGIGGAIVGI